jgi:hypothetical protein
MKRRKNYQSGFSQKDYDKARRKLHTLSLRELINYIDQYLTSLLTYMTAYSYNNQEGILLNMKTDLLTLMALVDEMHEEYLARHK